MPHTKYGTRFQKTIKADSLRSAERIVPILAMLIQLISVVDVGCGTSAWLSVFRKTGTERIFGIDGEYVDRQTLLIPENGFLWRDIGRPLGLNQRFDLLISQAVTQSRREDSAAEAIEPMDRAGAF